MLLISRSTAVLYAVRDSAGLYFAAFLTQGPCTEHRVNRVHSFLTTTLYPGQSKPKRLALNLLRA